MSHIYTMPPGVPFLPSLAMGLKKIYGPRLNEALILLPTRRAVRLLTAAFVQGKGISLLPRMRTLADIDPEEPPFEPGYLTGLVDPLMPPAQRRFQLAKVIAKYHDKITDQPIDPAGMLAMADPLISILDEAAMEEVSLPETAEFEDLREKAAEHFQNAAELYKIIQTHWPKHLNDANMMEPMARRVALLKALRNRWIETPPDHPVIIAGSTGSLKATARLMKVVANLDQGLIVLPGLDSNMPDAAWKEVGPEHPQNSLKNMMSELELSHQDIAPWPHISTDTSEQLNARRRVIAESLTPAENTSDWLNRIDVIRGAYKNGDIFKDAFQGLSIIEARTEDEEALTIALIMREVLQESDKTAALVTPDPALARRVKARLRRWGVEVDYSQGEPLEETSIGSFLSGILGLSADVKNPVDMAFICKHELTALHRAPGEVRQNWLAKEKSFRGLRPKTSEYKNLDIIPDIWSAISGLTSNEPLDAGDWAKALTEAAQTLANSDETAGAGRLWRGDAGEKAASLLEDLIAFGHELPKMDLRQFTDLLSHLMRGRVVRPRYGTHPRLQILGPLEARMLVADRIILGGLNEGVWPAAPSVQPFLSRGMRESIGLSMIERRYGLAAHDFAELAANQDVILTRAELGADGPKVASRWLWRLQILAKGALGDEAKKHFEPNAPYLDWARTLDHVDNVEVAPRPAPTPDVAHRWPGGRELSVTRFTLWVRDPYSIYARYILKLKPLDELDMKPSARHYGTAIHEAIDKFSKTYKNDIPSDAKDKLEALLKQEFIEAGYEPFQMAAEEPRLKRISTDFIDWMRRRQDCGYALQGSELKAEYYIDNLDFTLTAKADRIEQLGSGYDVIDFKTGLLPTPKVVKAGFDLQLPLTAYLLEKGAFKTLPEAITEDLIYVRLRGIGAGVSEKYITTPQAKNGQTAEQYKIDALENLTKLIQAYDTPETAYVSQPRIQYVNDYGDYDHLARRGEWARIGAEKGAVSD